MKHNVIPIFIPLSYILVFYLYWNQLNQKQVYFLFIKKLKYLASFSKKTYKW